jgi:hypothetical protein
MALPLMPKATAVWLVENTVLTFEQIAEFCGMHELEIQAIADGEVAIGITGLDPVVKGQLTADEIKRCEGNAKAKLKLKPSANPVPQARPKGTPGSSRTTRKSPMPRSASCWAPPSRPFRPFATAATGTPPTSSRGTP